jgi:hypothetical protein
MKSFRELSVLSIAALVGLNGQAAVADSGTITLTGTAPAASVSAADPTTQAAAVLQNIWDAAYRLSNASQDLAQEGTNWAPRPDWLQYYQTTIGSLLDVLKAQSTALAGTTGGAPAAAGIQGLVSDLSTQYEQLQSSLAAKPDKMEYRKPAEAVYATASKLDTLVLRALEQLPPPQTAAGSSTAGSAAGSGAGSPSSTVLQGGATAMSANAAVRGLEEATKKAQQASLDLINELERWNLLFGHPPAGQGTGTLPYGGGLSPTEIETQYKYLPSFAFTMPSYVRFSYRLAPRQQFLVMYTTQIGKLLNLMDKELADAAIPADKQAAAAGPWNEAKTLYKDAATNYLALLSLVNASTDQKLQQSVRDDQQNFGKPALAIYDDLQKMRRVLGDMDQVLGSQR